MKVVVYTRVSTGHEGQLTSMVNQQEYYEKYCKEKNYELVKVYADEGLSATSPKRKEFLEMLYDAGLNVERNPTTGKYLPFDISNRQPKFKYIITKDVSRFSRNTNAIEIVRNLKEKGVFIVFENAGFSTEDSDYELRLNLLLTFSQQESIDRSKKVSFAYKHRAEKGKFHMSRPLYGYQPDLEGGYTIIEDEAALVREIFDMYVNDNKGTKIISRELNEKGLKTRNGKNWRADGIKRMISNEKYKGQVVVNKYTTTGVTGSNRRIKRDDGEWFVYDDAIPAIVDKEIWDKAQEMKKDRTLTSKYGNKVGARTVKSIFHHKIKCSKCDSYFVRVGSQKTRKDSNEKITEYIYLCRNRRMFGTCDMKGISHNVLEREIEKLSKGKINELININLKSERNWAKMSSDFLDEKLNNIVSEKSSINKKITDKKDQIDKLFDIFLDGEQSTAIISATKRRTESLEKEIVSLEKKLNEYDTLKILKEKEKVKKKLDEIIKLSKKSSFTFDETLEMISSILITELNDEKYKRELNFSISTPTIGIYALYQDVELENLDINDHFYHNEYIVKL